MADVGSYDALADEREERRVCVAPWVTRILSNENYVEMNGI
jgi:hypothetical protein